MTINWFQGKCGSYWKKDLEVELSLDPKIQRFIIGSS